MIRRWYSPLASHGWASPERVPDKMMCVVEMKSGLLSVGFRGSDSWWWLSGALVEGGSYDLTTVGIQNLDELRFWEPRKPNLGSPCAVLRCFPIPIFLAWNLGLPPKDTLALTLHATKFDSIMAFAIYRHLASPEERECLGWLSLENAATELAALLEQQDLLLGGM